MRHLKVALGIVVTAGLMAVTAGPALAAQPVWAICEKTEKVGKWENSGCTKASKEGSWETEAVTETLEDTSSHPEGLELTDTKAMGGEASIKCAASGRGWIGPKGIDGTTRITITKCSFVGKKHGSCEESVVPTIRALNLPWNTRLEERAGHEVRDTIQSSGKGAPGFAVECTVSGIFKVFDECTGKTSAKVNLGGSSEAVETEFEEKSEHLTCSMAEGKAAETGIIRFKEETSSLRFFHLILRKTYVIIEEPS